MINWINAHFAKDRWMILRVLHYRPRGASPSSAASETMLMLFNRYDGGAKTVYLDGHWEKTDFREGVYRGTR